MGHKTAYIFFQNQTPTDMKLVFSITQLDLLRQRIKRSIVSPCSTAGVPFKKLRSGCTTPMWSGTGVMAIS